MTTYRLTRPLTGADDFRVLHVQRGEVAVGLGDIEVGHRLPIITLVPVIFFLADRPARDQDLGALVVALQSVHAGLTLRHGPLGPLKLGPVRPGVDLEELVVLLDQCTFLEVDRVEVTRDTRPHLDRIHRGRPAGEVGVVGDVPLDGITHRDRHRCGCWRIRGRPGAAGQADTKGKK